MIRVFFGMYLVLLPHGHDRTHCASPGGDAGSSAGKFLIIFGQHPPVSGTAIFYEDANTGVLILQVTQP